LHSNRRWLNLSFGGDSETFHLIFRNIT
jgi:hypothetical protein